MELGTHRLAMTVPTHCNDSLVLGRAALPSKPKSERVRFRFRAIRAAEPGKQRIEFSEARVWEQRIAAPRGMALFLAARQDLSRSRAILCRSRR